MNVSSASPARLSTPVDATTSAGPPPVLTSEPEPAASTEASIVLERVSAAKSPFVQAYAPHQLGSMGAPSYPRELNQPLGDDYKAACAAALHVMVALPHPPVAVHVGLAVSGHSATDLVCNDAAPTQIADR